MTQSESEKTDPLSWWYLFVTLHVLTVLAIVGTNLIVAYEQQTQGNSLQKLHDYSHIPWPVWGVGFWALAVAIALPRTRIWGYAASACVTTFFAILAILYTYLSGKSTNVVAVWVGTLGPTLCMAGVKYEFEKRVKARRGR